MQAQRPQAGSPRHTSFAPAAGLPPPGLQGQAAAPAPPATPASPASPAATAARATAGLPGTARVPKRAREEDGKAPSSASSSSSDSVPTGPLARRTTPLTQRPVRPAEGADPSGLPRPLLAIIAAYASEDQPLPLFRALCHHLGGGTWVSDENLHALLGHRPEVLFEIHPMLRTREDYRRYFAAGGTLAQIPQGDRDEMVCQMAVALSAHALASVPDRWQSVPMCREAVRREGWMLGAVPARHLAAGAPARAALCDEAYASGRPPRIKDVPKDLLTEARCLASLRRMPLDLDDIPPELMTEAMCVEAIRLPPPGIQPSYWAIPERLRGRAVADAMLARRGGQGERFPEPAWFAEEARSPEVLERFLQSDDHYAPATRLAFIQEKMERGQMTLALFAAILKARPDAFRPQHDPTALVSAMQAALQADGLEPGQPVEGPGWALAWLPRRASEADVWRWVGRVCPYAWQSLPLALRSEVEVCRQGLAAWPQNIRYVPTATLIEHPELIEVAVQAEPGRSPFDPSGRDARQNCTLGLLPASVCQALDPGLLERLCRMTVAKSGWTLGPVLRQAGSLLPPETVAELSAQAADMGCDWLDIPDRLKERLRLPALRNWGFNLASMDPQACTSEWCEAALGNQIGAWRDVPDRLKSLAMLERIRFTRVSLRGMAYVEGLPEAFKTRMRREFGVSLDLTLPSEWTEEVFTASFIADPSNQYEMDLAKKDEAFKAKVYRRLLRERPEAIFHAESQIGVNWLVYACQSGADPEEVARWASRRCLGDRLPAFMADIESLRVQGLLPPAGAPGRAADALEGLEGLTPAASSGSSSASPPRPPRAPG